MAKYKADWNAIEINEAATLIDAVARYASANDYPKIDDILSILAIKKSENKEGSCNG